MSSDVYLSAGKRRKFFNSTLAHFLRLSIVMARYAKSISKSSTAFLIILAMISSMLLFAVPRQVSATRAKTAEAAPVSAPPEPFIFHSPVAESSLYSAIAGVVKSAAGLIRGPQMPEGLGAIKPPTLTERLTTLLGFTAPATKAITNATTLEPPPQPASSVDFDFDGDGKADVGRWHSANTEYKIRNSNTASYTTYTIGTAGAKHAPADWDGDGKTDPAFFSAGTWTIRKSSTGTTDTITGFGQAGDIPLPGEYVGGAGSGIDAAYYRPSNGTWYFRDSATPHTVTSAQFGVSTDIPVPGDYDGDGVTDYAVYRPSGGYWYIQGSTAGYYVVQWGVSTDVPVAADYDGDGKTDPAVFRTTTGTWYFLNSHDATWGYYSWGLYSDQPVPADYDGDGKADFAIWRPTNGAWWIKYSSGSPTYDVWGLGVSGDFAVPSAYIKQVGGEVQQDDLAVAKLSPRNAQGGTNLYSQNFSWGSSLVSLPGRSGLDLNLGISYNSLVWTKVGSAVVFDSDFDSIAPGFKFGLPTIEPVYYDDSKSTYAYMMVTPSGALVEFRQTAVSNVYDTADSSYTQLVTTGATDPNDPVENIAIKVTTTDGTQMTYLWASSSFHCTEIKDRNGNYISATYDVEGRLLTVTDTLGRVVTVNYGTDITITQTWKDTNGSGSNVTHTWATLSIATKEITTDFDGLTVVGPPNGTVIGVLDKVTYSDGSATKFYYNDYAQVYKVENHAPDSTTSVPHVLNYVKTNIQTPSAYQTDCPRFTETKSFVENFNSGSEVTFNNTAPSSGSYSLPGSLSGGASVVDTWMTGHPDNLRTKIYYGASDWKEGLTLATEDCLTTSSTCSDRKRWTWTDWTQDNTSLTYNLNPRVTETRVGDSTNTKRTTIAYYEPSTGVFPYGLPETVQVYASDLSTVIKKSVTTYNTSDQYKSRWIIGLPSMVKAWGWNDQTNSLEYVSKVTFDYDGSSLSSVLPTQHDGTNYGTGFNYRGNLTSTTRWDVTDDTNSSLAVMSSTEYNTAGSPISQTDPRGRVTRIGYTDSFNSSVGVSTYAYPTVLTDAAGSSLGDAAHSSTIKYRYDIGANVDATSPAPAGNTYGKTSKRVFDSVGRLERNSIYINTMEYSYVRYEYPTNGVQSQTYAPVVDADGDGNLAEDEVLTESWSDGAGRVRLARVPHTFNTNGTTASWAGTITEYDILGRVSRQSVPTEVNSSWVATGDDATRGFLWTAQRYDWKGRVTRKINTDGDPNASDNDSDVSISYEGCGCAGGQVTTIDGERVPIPDTSNYARRKQRIYEDILGRQYKTESYEWDGSTVYSTVVNIFNGRDQVLLSRQYAGSTSATTYQDTTASFDGHGRVLTSHKPEQRDSSNNLKYTAYSYNADDSIHTVTDGRGAVTTYTYGFEDDSSSSEKRGLLTKVAYSVPEGSGITDPADVSFAYDNLGNRTSMTDGMGNTAYDYDSLSRMTSETRQFNDTLANAPMSSNRFQLSYAYSISGLKSYTDPYGIEIDYTADKLGRLNQVTGTSFAGVTSYASNPQYRAWGGLKQVEYGNGKQEAISFDNRLRPENDVVNEISQPTNKRFDKSYEYYADGQLKLDDDAIANQFDRSFQYDHQGRAITAKSGVEAHGQTETDLTNLPYRQSYSYNALGNLTNRQSTLWDTENDWNFSYSITNNRITNSGYLYDADGRVTRSGFPGATFEFDASGVMDRTLYNSHYETLLSRDGVGHEVKRSQRVWVSSQTGWGTWQTSYLIYSSVLGRVVTEAKATGSKKTTYVLAGGQLLSRQDIGTQSVLTWSNRDASGLSSWGTTSSGGREELDALGNNVDDHAPVQEPQQEGNSISPFDRINFAENVGDCEQDGIIMPCLRNGRDATELLINDTADGRFVQTKADIQDHGVGVRTSTWETGKQVPGWVTETDANGNSETVWNNYASTITTSHTVFFDNQSECDNRIARIFGDDDAVAATATEPASVSPSGKWVRDRTADPTENPANGNMHLFANATATSESGPGFVGNLYVPTGYSSIRGKADDRYNTDERGKNVIDTTYSNIQVTYNRGALSKFGYKGALIISMVHSGPINSASRVPTPIANGAVRPNGTQLVGTIGADGSPYDGGGQGGNSYLQYYGSKRDFEEVPFKNHSYVHSHFIFYSSPGKRIDPRSVFCGDLGF